MWTIWRNERYFLLKKNRNRNPFCLRKNLRISYKHNFYKTLIRILSMKHILVFIINLNIFEDEQLVSCTDVV